MASFSKTFDFNLRRDHQKNNDEKKNSGGKGLTHHSISIIFLYIYFRYAEVNYEAETPVQCFNNCIVDAPNMRGLDLGENAFFVNHESKIFFPSAGNSHPQLVIMPTDGTFHVLFRCRNSCDSHKKYGKNRFLLLETLDMAE